MLKADLSQFSLKHFRSYSRFDNYDIIRRYAAVVGVVLNLADWFALHVIFPGDGTADSFAITHRHRRAHQNGPLEVGYYPRSAWCGFCRPDLQNVLKLLS